MIKVKQIGPPVIIGSYQLSVTTCPENILARAILFRKSDRDRKDLPMAIYISDEGLTIDASNVASDTRVEIPNDVTRALLKMVGWTVEYPDSMNPNMR